MKKLFLKILIQRKKYWNYMSHLYFNEENYYSGENKYDNKVFQPTFFILPLKETKHIHA